MPHVDEMIGVATLGAAALAAAIMLQPLAQASAVERAPAAVYVEGSHVNVVKLPPIEVVARRSVEVARNAAQSGGG